MYDIILRFENKSYGLRAKYLSDGYFRQKFLSNS